MSARQSTHTKMIKRGDKMFQSMQGKIDRQVSIIDRLVKANMTQGDALEQIKNEDKDIRTARKTAADAINAVHTILEVPKEDKQ